MKQLCFMRIVVLFFIFAISVSAQEWQRLGPAGGAVISLASSAGGILYLGTADGHIFASADAAAHWELRGRVGTRLDGVVQRLVVDSRSAQRVFAAVWFLDPAAGGGIFLSEDGGHTWSLAGLQGEAVRVVEQSLSDPHVFVAGTRNGVFRSTDNGKTWSRISREDDEELRNIDSLAIDPHNSDVLYAGTYHLPWKTTDGGKTWNAVIAGLIDDSDVMSLRIDSVQPERIFASACSGIYRSENGGAQWTKLQGIPYSSRRTQVIAQDPSDPHFLLAGTTEGLWATHDAGESWMRASPPSWVINSAVFLANPGGISKIILGTEEQGILVSTDGGAHFTASNEGFSHRVVAALVGDANTPQHFLARVTGSSGELLETRDSGKTWALLPGTPPSGIKKLFATPIGWFATLAAGGLAQYDPATQDWRRWKLLSIQVVKLSVKSAKGGQRSRKITREVLPQILDFQSTGGRIYVATEAGIWAGAPAERILRPVAERQITGRVNGMEVSSGGSELWAATSRGIFHSTDGAISWTLQNPGNLTEVLWIRHVKLEKSEFLLVGAPQGVFRVPVSLQSAELLQSGLPSTASEAPLVTTTGIFVPMKSGGLYYSEDSANSWVRLDSPAEYSIFTGLAVDGRNGVLASSRMEGILHWQGHSSQR